MRQMKDSGIVWIKAIPQEWDVRIAKTIFVRMYRPVRMEDEVITCFRDGEVTLRKNRRTEGFTESLKEIGYQGIRKGDLVIHQMDAFAGSIGISDSDGKGSPVYICLRPQNENECLNKFYVYLLRQMAECGYIKSLYRGIRERSSDFRFETFAILSLPIPPFSEQRAIADYLDVKCGEVDALVSLQEEMISELQAYKQAVITEAVTHGLNPNAKMKDSGVQWIGSVPEHWDTLRLRFVCELRNGYTPPKANPEFWTDGTIPWYRMDDIRESGRRLKEAKQYITEEAVKGGGLFEAGSFIMATTATIGEHAVLIVDSLANQRFTNLKIRKSLSDSLLSDYFFYYLFVVDDYCKTTTRTATFPAVNMEDLKNFAVCIPPVEEQRKIVESIEKRCADIDALIGLKQQKIEELKEWKKSLIFECVTGKREIQQA